MTDKKPYKCNRCGKVNPAEIHTCTPIDPLLEALRVPENKREWVGLTDEEMMELYIGLKSVAGFYSLEKYARSVEAKLKEKNT